MPKDTSVNGYKSKRLGSPLTFADRQLRFSACVAWQFDAGKRSSLNYEFFVQAVLTESDVQLRASEP
jgi:hypothetical protein